MSETREPANAAMQQAIPDLVADVAAGSEEETFFFHENLHKVQIFVKKEKSTMLPQANRVSSGQTPGLNTHRVRRVCDILRSTTFSQILNCIMCPMNGGRWGRRVRDSVAGGQVVAYVGHPALK
jgi:hypothetical protein